VPGQRWSGCVFGPGFASRSLVWVGCCGLRFAVPGSAGAGDGLRPRAPPPPESICSKLKPVVVCPSEKCCYPKIFGIVPRRKS
jgi:hypothetical protein